MQNLGRQAVGILTSPKVVATAIAGGGVGLVGGAMVAGQQAEEAGAPLSRQATATLGGGFRTAVTGAAIGYGGSVALTAAKKVLGKK
jgi:hypothetical protein